ncbi:hypothetical protein ACQ4WX_46825 [Streptomyces lasalocidi]
MVGVGEPVAPRRVLQPAAGAAGFGEAPQQGVEQRVTVGVVPGQRPRVQRGRTDQRDAVQPRVVRQRSVGREEGEAFGVGADVLEEVIEAQVGAVVVGA